ncbi:MULTISPECIES: ABC transporter permease [Paenibacillus]|uniref:ABC transporter permease n=1 Tax=Paenibacillus TaxID=44249 RepID=UPI0003098A4D|nr:MULTISPECIES: ABC transporter permease [Paenibacillus]WFA84603.1 ABC transporter permease [Paenibacillus amylolyticus]
MKLKIYFKLLSTSLIRNKTVTSILTLQMAISLILVSIIVSFLNAGYHTIKDQVNRSVGNSEILLGMPISFGKLVKYEDEWRSKGELVRFSYIVSTDDLIKSELDEVVLPIFAVNRDYPYFFGFPSDGLKEGEVVLTVNAAKRIFPSVASKDIYNQKIEILGKEYFVKAIEQKSLVDRVYIPLADFRKAYEDLGDVVVGSLSVDQTSSKVILKDLESFKPKIMSQSSQSKYQSFISFLVLASIITIFLIFYSIINFVQLFSYKVNKEKDKWDILFLHGATRKDLKSYLYIETGIVTIVALIISAIGVVTIVKFLNVDGITFLFNYTILSVIVVILLIMVLFSVEMTLRKLRRNLLK